MLPAYRSTAHSLSHTYAWSSTCARSAVRVRCCVTQLQTAPVRARPLRLRSRRSWRGDRETCLPDLRFVRVFNLPRPRVCMSSVRAGSHLASTWKQALDLAQGLPEEGGYRAVLDGRNLLGSAEALLPFYLSPIGGGVGAGRGRSQTSARLVDINRWSCLRLVLDQTKFW
jgi:hypothetical protein